MSWLNDENLNLPLQPLINLDSSKLIRVNDNELRWGNTGGLYMQRITSLDLVKSGLKAIVREIHQLGNISGRLYSMGILPGTELEVVVNRGHGPIVVRVKGDEIALGRGLARKILVEVLDNA